MNSFNMTRIPRSCHGMTLIEVSVALVILGTLLVSTVIARGRYLKQSALAQRKLTAVTAADALLAERSGQWQSDPDSLVSTMSGLLPGKEKMNWRTQVVERDDAHALGARVLKLQIFDTIDSSRNMPAATTDPPLLASVEILVPVPRAVADGNKRIERQETVAAR